MLEKKAVISVTMFLVLMLCFLAACQPETEIAEPIEEPIEFVNSFIGTGADGNTFPGAARPFGMVQLSPINGGSPVVDPDAGYAYIGNKGYDYTKDEIIAFTHTSLSGTGTGHLSKYSNIGFMPTVGSIQVEPGTEGSPETGYRSHIIRENQEAHPGYYRVFLEDYGVNAELTATERVGVHRYTYPRSENANIIIDITQERSVIKEASVEIIDDHTIAGYTTDYGRWITDERRWAPDPETPTTWYFYAEFSKPFDSYGTFSSHEILQNERVAHGNEGVGAFVTYHTESDEEVIINVGISFSSLEGAKRNLREEVSEWDFDAVKHQSEEVWNEKLKRVQVSGGTRLNKIKYYTALYHSFLFPRTFTDVDGSYYSHFEDRVIHEDDFTYYVDFSLWDTYRAVHPLFNIIEPQRQIDMIKTVLAMYDQGGRIPTQVSYRNTYSQIMIGDHASTFIADSYSKGLRDFDVQKAYEAMRKNAFEPGPIDRTRDGLDAYMELGYVAADQTRESVSKTLEDAHTDWVLALVARDLGHMDDYEILKQRAYNYQNHYDPSTGFFRPRLTDGSWLPECEPGETPDLATSDFPNYYGEYWVYHDCFDDWWVGTIPYLHYTESNAHQYLFYVPHDVQGLIDLKGGRWEFEDRLDEFFTASSAISGPWWADWVGVIGQYIHGNEPSHHIAYMYNWAGAPWKAQNRVREVMETKYSADYRGLPGNDDMGQMSAWLIFSALGFYPVTPGVPEYVIGTPLFEKVEISLDDYYDNATFTVIAHNNSADNKFIQSATLNGEPFERTFITHEEIVNGGVLEFEMGPYPNYDWGSAPEQAPSSMSSR